MNDDDDDDDVQTMIPFIVLVSRPSLDRLGFLSETEKVGQTYFQRKIAEMTLKVDQGH